MADFGLLSLQVPNSRLEARVSDTQLLNTYPPLTICQQTPPPEKPSTVVNNIDSTPRGAPVTDAKDMGVGDMPYARENWYDDIGGRVPMLTKSEFTEKKLPKITDKLVADTRADLERANHLKTAGSSHGSSSLWNSFQNLPSKSKAHENVAFQPLATIIQQIRTAAKAHLPKGKKTPLTKFSLNPDRSTASETGLHDSFRVDGHDVLTFQQTKGTRLDRRNAKGKELECDVTWVTELKKSTNDHIEVSLAMQSSESMFIPTCLECKTADWRSFACHVG